MKNVLIYGDSLVYGKMPGIPTRYPREKNFIGVLERALGNEYQIVDEGLRARTLAGENSFFPERNGLEQFGPIYGSHVPLDLVCLFLGTNDCNRGDTKTEEDVYRAFTSYIEKIALWNKNLSIEIVPKILIIAPPLIRGSEVMKDEGISKIFSELSGERSEMLALIYEKFSKENGCIFFDASKYCVASDGEGVHLDEVNNMKLGQALAEIIQSSI